MSQGGRYTEVSMFYWFHKVLLFFFKITQVKIYVVIPTSSSTS